MAGTNDKSVKPESSTYRGRIAPSPTGYLHLGHARTFWIAHQHAKAAGGELLLRNEDLDMARCRSEYVTAMIEDLHWLGVDWSEGPDIGGIHGPYNQGERLALYRDSFTELRAHGFIYPCTCSRKEVQSAMSAPHESHPLQIVNDEPAYPGTCRPDNLSPTERARRANWTRETHNWRFLVPQGADITFVDGHFGKQHAVAGRDVRDFLIWRKDDLPSYQLACTVDDAAMRITEVVRGADLLLSTSRQLLVYRALNLIPPAFHHCPLVLNKYGVRLAKRHDALSLRALRAAGKTAAEVRALW